MRGAQSGQVAGRNRDAQADEQDGEKCDRILNETQARSARTGSIRVARRAGTKQAINATTIKMISAKENAIGSRGLTL